MNFCVTMDALVILFVEIVLSLENSNVLTVLGVRYTVGGVYWHATCSFLYIE
jgi:hypothetical protein